MRFIGLTQRVNNLKNRQERRDCLDQAWTHLLLKIGMLAVPLANCLQDVETVVLKLRLAGIILTGGNDLAYLAGAKNPAPERDDFEHKLLRVCAKRNIPVLGVCRGMQMLVVHYGGEIVALRGHVATCHSLTARRRNVISLGNRQKVNSFHNFGVRTDKIGDDLTVMATAADGTVEAVAHKKFPQFGIMWHPERTPFDKNDEMMIRKIFK